jgi:hypothetical protein
MGGGGRGGRKRGRRKDNRRRVSKNSVVDMGSASSTVHDLTSMPGATPLSKYWLLQPRELVQEGGGQLPYRIDSNGNPILLLPFTRPDYGNISTPLEDGPSGARGGADEPEETKDAATCGAGAAAAEPPHSGGDVGGGRPPGGASKWWDPALTISRYVDEADGLDSENARTAYRYDTAAALILSVARTPHAHRTHTLKCTPPLAGKGYHSAERCSGECVCGGGVARFLAYSLSHALTPHTAIQHLLSGWWVPPSPLYPLISSSHPCPASHPSPPPLLTPPSDPLFLGLYPPAGSYACLPLVRPHTSHNQLPTLTNVARAGFGVP